MCVGGVPLSGTEIFTPLLVSLVSSAFPSNPIAGVFICDPFSAYVIVFYLGSLALVHILVCPCSVLVSEDYNVNLGSVLLAPDPSLLTCLFLLSADLWPTGPGAAFSATSGISCCCSESGGLLGHFLQGFPGSRPLPCLGIQNQLGLVH